MKNPSLTVFSNFRINDEERLIRLKDSFYSFKDICAEKWVINIRGKLKENTKSFLKNELKEKAIITFHESDYGPVIYKGVRESGKRGIAHPEKKYRDHKLK